MPAKKKKKTRQEIVTASATSPKTKKQKRKYTKRKKPDAPSLFPDRMYVARVIYGMGDRANIGFVQHRKGDRVGMIYLYTHWGGHDLTAELQKALRHASAEQSGRSQQSLWSDESYLTRIVVSQITRDNVNELTGFGLSIDLTDNEHPILIVDCDKQTVSVVEEKDIDGIKVPDPAKYTRSMSFADFVKLGEKEIATFRGEKFDDEDGE